MNLKKSLLALVALTAFTMSNGANAALISIANVSGNVYEATFNGPVSYTMTTAIPSNFHAGIRIENVFANSLTASGFYVSGNSILSINGGGDILLNYNTNLPWAGAGKDFFLNTGFAWINQMPALRIGDVLTFKSHTFRFNTTADMTLSGAEGNSYISDSTSILSSFGSAPVPEPSVILLFVLGVIGVGVCKRTSAA